MSGRRQPSLDRLARPEPVAVTDGPPDADGRRALFSTAEQPPTIGTVTVACSGCEERTVVSLLRAVRLAVPSMHLPFLRPAPYSYMRCPACGRLEWVTLSVRL